ncbi:MAG: hypothetical protein G8345_13285, partial [Magnetococcales bacterium]|nr:hypothetical protein [Magnetococcales bacterium]
FQTLQPYASPDLFNNAYTACVRFRIIPVVAGSLIDFDLANSYVDVAHEVNMLPDLTFRMEDLRISYNDIRGNLAAEGGLKFFTGGGANPGLHILNGILNNRGRALQEYEDNNTAYPPLNNLSNSQAIPTSQRLDYYFPRLISTIVINEGSLTLVP